MLLAMIKASLGCKLAIYVYQPGDQNRQSPCSQGIDHLGESQWVIYPSILWSDTWQPDSGEEVEVRKSTRLNVEQP